METRDNFVRKQAKELAKAEGEPVLITSTKTYPVTVKELEEPVLIQQIHQDARIPTWSTPGSAGLDLTSVESVVVPAGTRILVSTGVKIKPPREVYVRIAPQSGLSLKGIDVGAGVVDMDYREVRVLIINNSLHDFLIHTGDWIVQLILERIWLVEPMEAEELDSTLYGQDGFGSTGINSVSVALEDNDDCIIAYHPLATAIFGTSLLAELA